MRIRNVSPLGDLVLMLDGIPVTVAAGEVIDVDNDALIEQVGVWEVAE